VTLKAATNVQEVKALQNIELGIGWSTDIVLARYFSVHRKTIWDWSREGKLPKPKKISDRRTRWNNRDIKAHNERINNLKENQLLGEVYK
tara:strand:+ start:203 stop:472 length:270 start_codon:yes stop_codon:yes gene_type:complete